MYEIERVCNIVIGKKRKVNDGAIEVQNPSSKREKNIVKGVSKVKI
jgi:hypothetical protein